MQCWVHLLFCWFMITKFIWIKLKNHSYHDKCLMLFIFINNEFFQYKIFSHPRAHRWEILYWANLLFINVDKEGSCIMTWLQNLPTWLPNLPTATSHLSPKTERTDLVDRKGLVLGDSRGKCPTGGQVKFKFLSRLSGKQTGKEIYSLFFSQRWNLWISKLAWVSSYHAWPNPAWS